MARGGVVKLGHVHQPAGALAACALGAANASGMHLAMHM
eukprot:CAMPEP_0174747916 /NCGR_PEP_ID=MMETSP1094-20130205/92316_1 /TAXON_ID=156173 /ORGANISM="Chrysochromulina brevifilum, Strain UTEX LB 985" /LENGTH=38 /DNA_ID= /DNA_START= /DNA_END= /DNA_ORIENTATION=